MNSKSNIVIEIKDEWIASNFHVGIWGVISITALPRKSVCPFADFSSFHQNLRLLKVKLFLWFKSFHWLRVLLKGQVENFCNVAFHEVEIKNFI